MINFEDELNRADDEAKRQRASQHEADAKEKDCAAVEKERRQQLFAQAQSLASQFNDEHIRDVVEKIAEKVHCTVHLNSAARLPGKAE